MIKSKKHQSNRLLYIQYTNPGIYPPLEHSSRILAQADWEVLFLGIGASGADALRFLPHPHITVYQIPFCQPGWRQKLHYIRYSLWVLISVLRWQPEWVYASDFLVCPIALILTFFPQLKVIYHEHDSSSTKADSLFISWCLQAREKLANRAKFCILPNQQRADLFDEEVKNSQHSICVWNCPAQEEIVSQRSPYQEKDNIWVLYHGSVVPQRLPLTVINALCNLPKIVKLRVIGYETIGHQGYINKLREVASELGISDRLEVIDPMPRKELLKWCEQSDIGLAFMPVTSQDVNLISMTGASNKPFDYLACGLPLVVSDLPDWKQMYVEPGYGLACNPEDANSIADVIRWYLEHPLEMKAMGENGRQRILHEWNYETQFEVIKNQL